QGGTPSSAQKRRLRGNPIRARGVTGSVSGVGFLHQASPQSPLSPGGGAGGGVPYWDEVSRAGRRSAAPPPPNRLRAASIAVSRSASLSACSNAWLSS